MSDIASTGRWGALALTASSFTASVCLLAFAMSSAVLPRWNVSHPTHTHARARSTVRGTHVAAKQPLATDGISEGDVCAELDEFLQGIHVAVGRGNDERRLAALRNTQQHHKQG